MNLTDLTRRLAEWLKGTGPLSNVVVSSRVRLARNLAGMPFLSRCSSAQQREIAEQLRGMLAKVPLPGEMLYVDVENADPLDRLILVERHLISRQHADATGPRGVAVAGGESVAVISNRLKEAGFNLVDEGLRTTWNPDEKAIEACVQYGRNFAKSV